MSLEIRTEGLRKIYTSAPPLAAVGMRGAARGMGSWRRKKQAMKIVALDGVSLQVRAGEIFGLLGPNGAGKTTTVGVLTTRVRPSAGDAWIGSHNVWQELVRVKRLIGVVPQRPNLDFSLTAREILTFHGAYFQVPPALRARRAAELLERFKLTDRANEMLFGFSGGMLQRLSIARAMMHDPDVLFLDEPSAGLDPQTRLLLWDIIREYHARGKTILLTTHNMEEADALCERLAIVDHGKVIALGSVGQTQIGLMFSMVLAPMIFFGCTYYPWKTLEPFPVLQWAVLINPVVYASEGLRSAFVPQYPHLPVPLVLSALIVFDLAFIFLGLRQFRRKAVS